MGPAPRGFLPPRSGSKLIMDPRSPDQTPKMDGALPIKDLSEADAGLISGAATHLLDIVRETRERAGAGLSDHELTLLLRQAGLPTEAGFGFLSFSVGVVTLSVPQQDPATWYQENGWIVPEKERIGMALAERYGLLLSEPPDQIADVSPSRSGSRVVRHRLELINRWEAVVVAHPSYLKVRLYGATSDRRYVRDPNQRLPFGPELLQTLSALYAT